MKAKLLLAGGIVLAVLLVSLSIFFTASGQQRPTSAVAVGPSPTAETVVAMPTATPVLATAAVTSTDTPPAPTVIPATATPSPVATDEPTSTARPTDTATPQASPLASSTPVPAATSTPAASPTVAAVQANAPATSAVAKPTEIRRLRIPSIGVDSYIESVGLLPDGSMDVPHRWEDVAWYDLGYHIGDAGNAVIAGHLDSDVAPAVFWRLGEVPIGGHIYVDWDSATHYDFVVRDKKNYAAEEAPIQVIYGPSSHANLNLITCGGTWNRAVGAYNQRLVVFTSLVDAGSAG